MGGDGRRGGGGGAGVEGFEGEGGGCEDGGLGVSFSLVQFKSN